MRASILLVVLLAWLPWVGLAHDDEHWEWVGVFDLAKDTTYTWTAEKDHDKYPDASMQIVIFPVDEADEKSVKAVKDKAEDMWHADLKNVTAGETIVISNPTAGNLIFDYDSWVTLFYLSADEPGKYAFFCQHFPAEFEQRFHYFKDDHGHDIEPDYVEPEPKTTEAPGLTGAGWILSLGGSFLTTVPALLMVFVVGPGITNLGDSMKKVFPFCSGAIGGAAAFLILPEATHFMPIWLWGTAVLLGWLIGVWIHHITDLVAPAQSHALHQHHARTSAADVAAPLEVELAKGGTNDQAVDVVATTSSQRADAVLWAAASPILFGDAIHGFVDGLLIGFSARYCGPGLTWTIIAATVIHEVPVEVSTITVLVTQARMRLWQATWWNFFTAQTALLGAVAGYGLAIPDAAQGFALALCGGIFIFIAFTELAPQLLAPKTSCGDSLCSLFLFAFGAACLGLVLLNHEHCVVGGGEDGGGHGHGH